MYLNTYRLEYLIIAHLLLGFFTTGQLPAQDRSVIRETQQWIQFYNQTKLSANLTLLADGGYRWRAGLAQGTQYITGNFQFSSTSEADSFRDTDVLWLGIMHKLDFTKNVRS